MNNITSDKIDYEEHIQEDGYVYMIKAPMGCGKTSKLLDYAEASYTRVWIYVSYRRSLTSEICTKAG